MTTPKAFLLGAVFVSLLAGSTALARVPQSGPTTLPDRIINATEALSGADQGVLAKFIEGYTNSLETAKDSATIEDARRALIEPFRTGLARPAFRNAFSNAAVKPLKRIIEGTDTRRAILAMQVAAFIATKDSLALITSRLSDTEKDVAKRQNAASTIGHALENMIGSNARPEETAPRLNDVDFDGVTRAITAAAEKETEVTITLQELKALSIIASRSGIGAKSATLARANHVTIVESVLNRVAASKAPDVGIRIVTAAIGDFQRQWTRAPATHATVGPVIAPLLVKVLKTSAAQWDAAHGAGSGEGDDVAKRDYADAVAGSEVLLRVVDSRLRSNAAAVTAERAIIGAWDAGDRKAFEEAVAKWEKVVSEKPYR
ncbi:MAG: hypothetical protein JNL80_07255 [Phycisphaerae bacterium]|jgi:hypothetical protein|nr:hypothetical protein [Phycisphaerae bacterium]